MQSECSWKRLCKFWINNTCISNLQQYDINGAQSKSNQFHLDWKLNVDWFHMIKKSFSISHVQEIQDVTLISFLWRFLSTTISIPANITPCGKCWKVFFTSSFMVVIMWITMVVITKQSSRKMTIMTMTKIQLGNITWDKNALLLSQLWFQK